MAYLPPFYCIAPFRVAERMPRSDAPRGSLSGQGSLYQYAFRVAALAQLLVSAWLTQTVSYVNHVRFAEVATRFMEVCQRQMRAGPHETHEVEKYDNGGSPWAYNSALDSFAGSVLFGIVVNAHTLLAHWGSEGPAIIARAHHSSRVSLPAHPGRGNRVIEPRAHHTSRVPLPGSWEKGGEAGQS